MSKSIRNLVTAAVTSALFLVDWRRLPRSH